MLKVPESIAARLLRLFYGQKVVAFTELFLGLDVSEGLLRVYLGHRVGRALIDIVYGVFRLIRLYRLS